MQEMLQKQMELLLYSRFEEEWMGMQLQRRLDKVRSRDRECMRDAGEYKALRHDPENVK
jgi:hypothetical protein